MAEREMAPSATVYINNLDERTKIPELVDTIRATFEEYGNIIDIIAKKNVKAKGQAFVVYDDEESAQTAIDELQGFEMFGKEIRLAFAKTRSDATVQKEDGDEGLEVHKRHRLAEKERKQTAEANAKSAKRSAAETSVAERPAKAVKPPTAPGLVPDEYLPPNKILFLRQLPEDYGKEMLSAIFSRFAGFKEVRTVPGRKEMAFVEYENEDGAITAKEATTGMALGDKTILVTYQRQ